ncbi:MAG: glycosyltransferase family 2 protein, partial [Smithella sp.]
MKEVQLLAGVEKEVIIVNDFSTDNTEEEILQYKKDNPELNLAYYKHSANIGKGAALHTGIDKAKGDFIIIQDADLEYNPQEYNLMLQPILDGFADVVYG